MRDLGYPSVKHLWRWYRCYMQIGDFLPDGNLPGKSYSADKHRAPVYHYLETERCVAYTIRALDYRDDGTLRIWLNDELGPTPQS